MGSTIIEQLRLDFQEILNLIAAKKTIDAKRKLDKGIDKVNDLIDFTNSEEDILLLGRYQLLIEHLEVKIDRLKSSFN